MEKSVKHNFMPLVAYCGYSLQKVLCHQIFGQLALFTGLLIFFFILTGCSKKETIVAQFGKHTITLDEFRAAYLEVIKQPNVFDSKELREEFLDEMIRRRLLAEEAKRLGMHEDERLKYRIEAYRDKCLREIHYQKIIKPQIDIQEKDVEEAYLFSQEKRRIKHLFAETKVKADSLYKLLKLGVPFDDLANMIFPDTSLACTGGDLGWVDWNQLEYDLAMTAFRQPLNACSKPVKSQFGHHIVLVTDYQKKPLITRQEYLLHREKAKFFLESKIGKKIAGEYIEQMMSNKKIEVYPKILEFVGKKLSENIKRPPSKFDQMYVRQLCEEEIGKIESGLWDVRHKVLSKINGQSYTVGEFISALLYIPYDVTYQSYKKALDFVFRDFVLTKEAIDLSFDNSPKVKRKTRLYEEYLLQMKLRTQLVREVTVDEPEIRAYYEKRKNEKYKNVKYNVVNGVIHKRLLQDKKAERIPECIRTLTQGMTIHKDLEPIHTFYNNITHQTPHVLAESSSL